MAKLIEILLDNIIPDPGQPRTIFDPVKLQELAVSIEKYDVLQPITVYPFEDHYRIKYGERRWRASKIVMEKFPERNTIWANVMEEQGSDNYERQIIENLHREDLNPMEEAFSYKTLLEKNNVEEIALSVGKQPSFVATRLRLCELADEWQALLLANKMKLSLALKVARLPKKTQTEVFKDAQIPKDWQKKADWFLSHIYRIDEHEQDLNNAKFKLNDKTLYPDAGACNTCSYNSHANKLVFPELAKKKICHNGVCFSIKTARAFTKAVESAMTDPEMIFFNNSHYLDKEEKQRIEQVENLGYKVWGKDHIEKVHIPVSPGTWEDYFSKAKDEYDWEDGTDEERMETETEIKEEYDQLLKEYQVEISEYERELAEGRFKKAFVVAGHEDVGEIISVRVKPQKAHAIQKQNGDSSKDPVMIEAEKNEVIGKIERLKELGREKNYKKLIELFNPDKNPDSPFFKNDANLSKDEYAAFLFAMAENCSQVRTYLFAHFQLQDNYRNLELYNSIRVNQSIEVLQAATRVFIYHKLINANECDYGKLGKAAAIYELGKQYFPDQLAKIEKEQVEKDKNRNYNLKQRLEALTKKQRKLTGNGTEAPTPNNTVEEYEETSEETLEETSDEMMEETYEEVID